jgi:hypothetical protein
MTNEIDTVFVIGAGFSHRAGIPLQSEILSAVRSLDLRVPPLDIQAKYFDSYALVQEFMNHFFELVENPTLEDVFTFLDDAILRRQHCLGFKWKDLAEVHSAFLQLIAVSFLDRQARISHSDWKIYRDITAAMRVQVNASPPSVVLSLNWDCVVERALALALHSEDKMGIRCCPASTSLGGIDEIEAWRPNKSPELSVLKLHGSIDWFLCPECGRLFTGSAVDESDLCRYAISMECPYCGPSLLSRFKPTLLPLIVSPTYLKGIDQPRLSLIWHWAHLALRTARRVVFVGYSLPGSDFALRNLLKRSIGSQTVIEVVLRDIDDYRSNTPRELRFTFPVERYRQFFGESRNVTFHLAGLESYFLEN